MSTRRKADYVYVPKKKIKKIVIDATKGSKPVEKVITQQQILDGAYVRAAALKEFRNYNFAHGGMTKNFISVGDVVREKKSGLYFIVYEVKNGVATKSYVLPTDVGEAIAFANDPAQIDWDKYTMYSDQSLNSNFSVGDMVYVEKHRKSGVIIGKGSRSNGEYYYTVRFANDSQDSLDDSELELINTYKRGGNIGSYNTGRSWKQDHNQHNKSESYEIPMDKRKFMKGGSVGNKFEETFVVDVYSELGLDSYRIKATDEKQAFEEARYLFKKENPQYKVFDLSMRDKFAKGGEVKTPIKIKKQLESIRKSIQNENVSYAQLAELQSLSKYIDPNDIELREWAGIPELEDGEEFAKGGKIKNQYAGKTAREVWGMWTAEQREHFLGDHYHVGEYRPESIAAMTKMTYDELRSNMATISGAALYTLEDHIMRGQYKRGGNIGSYNTGRSWTLDHNQHNKRESYEIPMGDRKYAKGGKADIQDKKYMLLYDFVDEKMVEGDSYAKKMIKSKGYSLTYDELYNFVDEKMIEGDSDAENLLNKINSLYATGGEIPDLTNMNIDHLFANGGRTYPITEEKIYI